MRRPAFTKLEFLVVCAGLLVLMLCAGFILPLQLLFFVLFGWIMHVIRLSEQVRINWTELIWTCVALGLFTTGLHWFCCWFASARRAKPMPSGDDPEFPPVGVVETDTLTFVWKPKWTIAITSVILLMFVAGISMVGMTHHLAWMLGSEEQLITDGIHYARRSSSQNHLKQIGIGLHNHHDDVSGALPAGATANERGELLHGWMTAILPFVEQQALADKIDQQRSWEDPVNAEAFRTQIRTYQLPYREFPQRDAKEYGMAGYSGNKHVLGGTGPGLKLDQITDGTSNTILAGEAFGNYKPWGHPRNWRDPALGINQSADGFGGPRKSGGLMTFADGSVRHLPPDIDPAVLKALATPDGGEPLPDDLP